MAAQTQDAYAAFQQNLLKLASVIECRPNNLATGKAGITKNADYGGTNESATTLIGAISTFITNLG